MRLENKHILITAGPTWIPIDKVRVISNTATGATGILLAEKLSGRGAKVTLLLGPVPYVGAGFKPAPTVETYNVGSGHAAPLRKNIKIIRFTFFDELKAIIAAELRGGKYDAVIHSAAVSDYRPRKPLRQKIRSGLKNLRLDLVPTEKIIDSAKKIDRALFAVGFKFEPEAAKGLLIKEAKVLLRRARLDLVAANTTLKNKYRAYIVADAWARGPLTSKTALAKMLAGIMEKSLCASY